MDELLKRYTPEQQEVIAKYWDTIRWTRKHGKISEKIMEAEMDYWSQFDAGSVIEALKIHIEKYVKIKEHYTRGIIRNIAVDTGGEARRAYSKGPVKQGAPKSPQHKKSRFHNFEGREMDFEALEYLERLKLHGLLDGKREELKKDPRYAKYLK